MNTNCIDSHGHNFSVMTADSGMLASVASERVAPRGVLYCTRCGEFREYPPVTVSQTSTDAGATTLGFDARAAH